MGKTTVMFGEARELLDSSVAVYEDEVTVEGWMAVGDPDDELVKEYVGRIAETQAALWNAVGQVVDEILGEWKNFVHEQKGGEEDKYPAKVRFERGHNMPSKDDARIDNRGAGTMMRLDGGITWKGWKLDREEGLDLVRMLQEGTNVARHRVTWEGR